MTQERVRTVEFGGFDGQDPWVCVNGTTYRIGDHIDERYGFQPGTVLTERLFRIAVGLAIAAKLERSGQHGWHSADEIVVSVEPLATPDAIRKCLVRAVRGYLEWAADELVLTERGYVPNINLIQYRPMRLVEGKKDDGRTQGPYRIGVPSMSLTLDVEKALAFLGHSQVLLAPDGYELEDAIRHAERLAADSDYVSARGMLLRSMFGARAQLAGAADYERLGRAYYFLGHYSMQLRLSQDAIYCARQTQRLYEKLGDSGWVASALVTESNAEGQLGNYHVALTTARRARDKLDNVDARRRRWMRTGRVGVVGIRYSQVGNFAAAERTLQNAFRLAEEAGDALKVYTWTLRRAQNFLRQSDLIATERTLAQAEDFHARFGIGGIEGADLWHVTAEFMVSTGQSQEAARYVTQAMDFAVRHRLQNKIGRLADLIKVIERAAPDGAVRLRTLRAGN